MEKDVTLVKKNASIFLLVNVLSHVHPLIIIPILTRYLSENEFGTYILFVSLVSILQLVTFSLSSNTILRFYVSTKDNDKPTFLFSIFAFAALLQLFFALALLFSNGSLLRLIYPSIPFELSSGGILFAFVFWFFICPFRQMFNSIFKAKENPQKIVTINIVYSLVVILLIVFNSLFFENGLLGVVGCFLAAELVNILWLTFRFKSYFNLKFDTSVLNKIKTFSAPFLLAAPAMMIFMNLDRYFLSRVSSLEKIGIYGIGLIVFSLLNVIISSLNSSILPRSVDIYEKRGSYELKPFLTQVVDDTQKVIGILIACFILGVLDMYYFFVPVTQWNDENLKFMLISSSIIFVSANARFLYLTQNNVFFIFEKPKFIARNNLILLVLGLSLGYLASFFFSDNFLLFFIPASFLFALVNMRNKRNTAAKAVSFNFVLHGKPIFENLTISALAFVAIYLTINFTEGLWTRLLISNLAIVSLLILYFNRVKEFALSFKNKI